MSTDNAISSCLSPSVVPTSQHLRQRMISARITKTPWNIPVKMPTTFLPTVIPRQRSSIPRKRSSIHLKRSSLPRKRSSILLKRLSIPHRLPPAIHPLSLTRANSLEPIASFRPQKISGTKTRFRRKKIDPRIPSIRREAEGLRSPDHRRFGPDAIGRGPPLP